MLDTDLFVGSVAIALGAFVASAAIFNWDWYYQLRKPQWVESLWGRTTARIIFAIVGLGLIVLGGVIAIGMLTDPTKKSGSENVWQSRHLEIAKLRAYQVETV